MSIGTGAIVCKQSATDVTVGVNEWTD